MIHQHHAFSSGAQQMISCQDTNDFFIFIQNGITGFSVLQNLLFDMIQSIIEMETYQILGAADSSDRCRLKNQSGSSVSIAGCRNDAGLRIDFQHVWIQFGAAKNQTVYIPLQSLSNQIRLIATDDNTVAVRKQGRSPALRDCQDHFTGHCVQVLTCLIDHLAFQHGKHIE